MNYGKLAYTGMGTLTVGGVALNQYALLAIAAGVIVAGVALIRFGWRRGKPVNAK